MVKLIHITPNAPEHIAYCARVSSPHQDNPNIGKLLKYLIDHKHWSPFEMASACFEITTTRMISAQILRHRSFHFQEFSQRYSEVQNIQIIEPRRQDINNRQNSIDDLGSNTKKWFIKEQESVAKASTLLYNKALKRGIAKECARAILPMSTETKLYMHGTIRDFIHYVNVRTEEGTQKEHRDIALAIKEILKNELITIAKALGW